MKESGENHRFGEFSLVFYRLDETGLCHVFGSGSPLSRIETKGGRDLGGGHPWGLCHPSAIPAVYWCDWVLPGGLGLPEIGE